MKQNGLTMRLYTVGMTMTSCTYTLFNCLKPVWAITSHDWQHVNL